MSTKFEACIFSVLWMVSLLVIFFLPASASQDRPISEDVAVITGYPEILVIKNYDIILRTELEKNSLRLEVTLVLENKSSGPIDKINFDLFAREKYYGVSVDLMEVSRLLGGKQLQRGSPGRLTPGLLIRLKREATSFQKSQAS